jgi:hypothetical protein
VRRERRHMGGRGTHVWYVVAGLYHTCGVQDCTGTTHVWRETSRTRPYRQAARAELFWAELQAVQCDESTVVH